MIPCCDGIYFQRSEVVTESDYDFYDVSSNEYYRYTPYFYNLKKNKIIELDKKDFPYLMIYTDILVDANREHLDSHIAEYWDLSVSKDISNENVGLCHFSKDLVVTKLPNGFDPTEICKIGTGYINVDDRILYDENMAYVDTLGVNVVAVCGNYAVFKNSINYYGVIDQNGTIVYNPVFHNFYDYYSNDQVMYFTSNSYDNFAIYAKTGKAIADESYEGSNYVVKFVDGTVKYANKEFYKLDSKDDDFFIWSQGSLHISRFDLREFVIFAHLREDGAITFVTTDVKYFEY